MWAVVATGLFLFFFSFFMVVRVLVVVVRGGDRPERPP
jgi:hypothetical protein